VTVPATPQGQPTPVVSVRLEPGVAAVAAPGQPATAAGRLYVGHNSPRLSLIDAASNLLLKHSDPLGQGRLTLMAPSRDQQRVYATWNGSSDLLVLNAADLSLENKVSLESGGITSLALHPQNGRLWVATFSPESSEASVLLELDGGSLAVQRRMQFNQSSAGLRFLPDGSLLYVRHRTANLLSLVDPITATVRTTARLPQWPTDMALSSDGRSLYVVNLGSERLMELDAATGEPLRSIEIGRGASGVIAHPDGQRLFVVNQMLGYVQVLNVASGQVDDLVPVGRAPQGAALSADARSLYVANSGAGTVSLVDLEGKRVRDTLNTGGTPSTLLLI
jgi:YVTN family beta-propeller protein